MKKDYFNVHKIKIHVNDIDKKIINLLDPKNFVIEGEYFYFKKIKGKFIDNNSIFSSLVSEINMEYNSSNGYRVYDKNIRNDRKVVRKQKKSNNTEKALSNLFPKELENKVLCDNSLNVLKTIPSNSVDAIITSPPYNFGINYGNYYDSKDWNDYFEFMSNLIVEIYRVLKSGGRVVWNVQPLFSDYVPVHHIFSNIFLKNNFIWRNEIIWEKNNYSARYTSWGSWLSASSPYLKYTHEFIEVFSKESIVHKNDNNTKSDLDADEFKKAVIGRWSIAPERKMKEFGHDAMFPEKLVERAMKIFTHPGDLVIDPFGGVGTTALVAKKNNRRFLSIDISTEYTKTAKKRLKYE